MRILHITSHMNLGGVTRYVLSLSEQLIGRGHRVGIASGGGRLEESARSIGVAHWRVPLNTSQEFSLRVFRTIEQITDRLKTEPVDLLHAHTRVGQVVADQISRRQKIPYVTTWHGVYKLRVGRRFYPCLGGRSIAISDVVQKHLLRDFRIPETRVRLVYNGIDSAHYAVAPDAALLRQYRRRWRILEDRPVMGGIGRLAAGEVKGFDLLLGAACLLKEEIPGLQVLIVGEGPRRPFLEDVAERLGILSQVRFVGGMDDIRIPLALMDLLVFPSRWPEAFGLVLVEAMAAGKPVVAVRIGAVPEIIRDGTDGLLTDPEDIQGLAQGVSRVLNDRALAQRLAAQARARIQERFDVKRMAMEVESVYREVLEAT